MGAIFGPEQAKLRSIARFVAGRTLDPDDLLSDAVTTTVGKWRAGCGPTANVVAYAAQTMRNRVRDEARSPRSRVIALEGIEIAEQPRDHDIDLHAEFAQVRRALAALPADQRLALVATVVDGRKPADLVDELRRPAPAISSLLRRAKLGLRRAILVDLIHRNAQDEVCRRGAQSLPERVPTDLDDWDDAGSRTLGHVRSCTGCTAAWESFASLPFTLVA